MTAVSQPAFHGLRPQEWNDVTAPPPGIALAAAGVAGEFDAETLDTGALRRLVARLALRSDLWKPLVVSDRTRRRYRLMLEDERLDVWVLSWMPGQATGFHDHGNSNVALTTLQGSVLERQIRVGEASIERELRPGFVQTGPAGYIHAVTHAAGVPAVTLHAYSPPLVRVGQYRAGPGGALLREPQHGRQELLDSTIEKPAGPEDSRPRRTGTGGHDPHAHTAGLNAPRRGAAAARRR